MAIPKLAVMRGQVQQGLLGGDPSTISTLALNSAYVYGTSGVAFAHPFLVQDAGNLTDFWICISAIGGTGSADGNINWEIREAFTGVTINYKPGSTVVASGTIPVAGMAANTWTKVTGLSVALSPAKNYFLVIGDADGGATNFITVVANIRNAGSGPYTRPQFQTTTGWNTLGTNATYHSTVALKVGGVMYGGSIIRATVAVTNNALRRGWKLVIAADQPPIQIYALSNPSPGVSGGWQLDIIKGASALPNAAPVYSDTIPAAWDYSATQQSQNFILSTPVTLTPGETWYITWKPDASITSPQKSTAYAGMDADLRSLLSGFYGIQSSYVQEAAGPVWVEDTDASPLVSSFALFFTPITATTAAAYIG